MKILRRKRAEKCKDCNYFIHAGKLYNFDFCQITQLAQGKNDECYIDKYESRP